MHASNPYANQAHLLSKNEHTSTPNRTQEIHLDLRWCLQDICPTQSLLQTEAVRRPRNTMKHRLISIETSELSPRSVSRPLRCRKADKATSARKSRVPTEVERPYRTL